MKWKITYYNKKVFNEIMQLPKHLLGKYAALTEMMLTEGPDLGMPHTRAMGNGLLEIRLKTQEGIARVFFGTMKAQEIVILHSYIKKTQQTPNQELEIARKRLREVKNED